MPNRGRHKARSQGTSRGKGVSSGTPRLQQQFQEHPYQERDSPIEPSDEASEDSFFEEPYVGQNTTNFMEDDVSGGETEIHTMGDGRDGGIPPSSSRRYTHQTEVSDDGTVKKIVEIVNGRFIGGHVSHEITNDIKSFFPGAYPTWGKVPNDEKTIIFDKFQEKWTWAGATSEQVRSIWNNVARGSYNRALSTARNDALDKSRDRSYTEARKYRPSFINQDYWNALITGWDTSEFKLKCETASKNRRTTKEGKIPTHTGGSINFVTHWKNMELEKKRQVGQYEVFLRTHKKKQGTGDFVDKAAELTQEKYKELVTQVHGEGVATDYTFYDGNLWKEAAGGAKKGKVYGSISQSSGTRHENATTASKCGTTSHDVEALEEMKEKLREEMDVEMKKQMEDKLAEQRMMFEEKMKEQEEKLKQEQEEREKMQEVQSQMKKQMETFVRSLNASKKRRSL